MATAWLLLAPLIGAGCAAGVRSSLLEAEVRLQSPALSRYQGAGQRLPVIYPAGGPGTTANAAGRATGMEQFGPAWQGLEPVYREYRFNPFES
ncbi:MAG: hypothetical protein U5J62_10960 [Desulfurivibrio sp.]|nr:hypothetical protein [Desulfurivibrio sp.]